MRCLDFNYCTSYLYTNFIVQSPPTVVTYFLNVVYLFPSRGNIFGFGAGLNGSSYTALNRSLNPRRSFRSSLREDLKSKSVPDIPNFSFACDVMRRESISRF